MADPRTGPDGVTWCLLPRHDDPLSPGRLAWFRAPSSARLERATPLVRRGEAARFARGNADPSERIAFEALGYQEHMRARGEEVSTAEAVSFAVGRMPEALSLALAAGLYRAERARAGRDVAFSEAVRHVRSEGGTTSFADPHAAHARAMAYVRTTYGLPDDWALGKAGWDGEPPEYGETWRDRLEVEFARGALAARLHRAAEMAAGRATLGRGDAMAAADDLLDGRPSEADLVAATRAEVARDASRGVTTTTSAAARVALARLEPSIAHLIQTLPPVRS